MARGIPFLWYSNLYLNNCLDQVKEKKSDLKKDYEAIIGVAPEFQEFNFYDFCWARMTASSRIFGIVIEKEKTDAFVPLAGKIVANFELSYRYVESQET